MWEIQWAVANIDNLRCKILVYKNYSLKQLGEINFSMFSKKIFLNNLGFKLVKYFGVLIRNEKNKILKQL